MVAGAKNARLRLRFHGARRIHLVLGGARRVAVLDGRQGACAPSAARTRPLDVTLVGGGAAASGTHELRLTRGALRAVRRGGDAVGGAVARERRQRRGYRGRAGRPRRSTVARLRPRGGGGALLSSPLALSQKARKLGGERVARRDRPPALDSWPSAAPAPRRTPRSRNRIATASLDLLRVGLGRLARLDTSISDVEQVARAVHERLRRARARRQRDVVRHGGPEAHRRQAALRGRRRGGRRRSRSGPRSARLSAELLDERGSLALPVTGASRVRNVREQRTERDHQLDAELPARSTISSAKARQRRFGSMPSSRTASRSVP